MFHTSDSSSRIFLKGSGYIEILYTVILAVCVVFRCHGTPYEFRFETCTVATHIQYSGVALHITCLLASSVNFLKWI